jgi:hypothetical protein
MSESDLGWRAPVRLTVPSPRAPAELTGEARAQEERLLHTQLELENDALREIEDARLSSEIASKDRELELLRKEAELLRKEKEIKQLRAALEASSDKVRATRRRSASRSSSRSSSSSRSHSPARGKQGRRKKPERARARSRSGERAGGNSHRRRSRSRSRDRVTARDRNGGGGFAHGSFGCGGAYPGGPPGNNYHNGGGVHEGSMGGVMAHQSLPMMMMHHRQQQNYHHGRDGPAMPQPPYDAPHFASAPPPLMAGLPRTSAGSGSIQRLTVKIPNTRVGTVIGKQGTTVAQIERLAGVSITIEKTPVPADGMSGVAGELARNLHLEARDAAALQTGEQLIMQLLADQIDGRLLAMGIIQPVSKPPQPRFR